MTYRLRNIAVAVGLALVAALLTTFYVANYKRHVRQTESTVKVFVAKRDIPQGTPGTELIKQGCDRHDRRRPAHRRARARSRASTRCRRCSPTQTDLRRRAGHAPPLRVAPASRASARSCTARCARSPLPGTSTSCSRGRSRTATTST